MVDGFSVAYPTRRRLTKLVLPAILQGLLFLALTALSIWTIYFNTYPPIHDATHALRHHTLGVPCH
jgi:hypothetical protein